MNEKNIKRNPLINEVEIDVAGKSISEVLEQAINIVETTPIRLDYEYIIRKGTVHSSDMRVHSPDERKTAIIFTDMIRKKEKGEKK